MIEIDNLKDLFKKSHKVKLNEKFTLFFMPKSKNYLVSDGITAFRFRTIEELHRFLNDKNIKIQKMFV